MSRCSPYPPLGYVWNGVSGEALVELIKVKREWALAEKRKKKEKRRQRKKEKAREKQELKKKKRSWDKRHQGDWNAIAWERSDCQKKREYEPPKLENFSLIEELEQHIFSEGPCCPFYNSQNFNRRKPCSFNCGCLNAQKDASIIWNEFLHQKHLELERLSSRSVCSNASRMEEKCEMVATPDKRHICSTLCLSKFFAQGMDPRPACRMTAHEGAPETVSTSWNTENDSLKIESQLRELLDNWIPDPQLREHPEFDDQEWLFETRSVQRNTTEWSKSISDDFHESSSIYPCATYLPEVDVYALPFTIIF